MNDSPFPDHPTPISYQEKDGRHLYKESQKVITLWHPFLVLGLFLLSSFFFTFLDLILYSHLGFMDDHVLFQQDKSIMDIFLQDPSQLEVLMDSVSMDPVFQTLLFLSQGFCALLVLFVFIRRPRYLSWKEMGFSKPFRFSYVWLGILSGIGFIVISSMIEMILRSFGIEAEQEIMFDLKDKDFPSFLLLLFSAGFLVPLYEEMLFRGFFIGAFVKKQEQFDALMNLNHPPQQTYFVWAGIFLSSIIFSLFHMNLSIFLPIAAGSIVFGYVFYKTKSLYPTIIGHAVNNIFAFSMLYLYMNGYIDFPV